VEEGRIMAKHDSKGERDGQGTFDPSKTKDVRDAGGGRHDKDDKQPGK
jgi:hypothetical protein